jgi:hypothetical protein
VNYSPQDIHASSGSGSGAGPVSQVAGGVNGGAGGAGARIENDTKDVSASHMTNNSHNEMNINFNHNQP